MRLSFSHLRVPQGFPGPGTGLRGEPALDLHGAAAVSTGAGHVVRAVAADVEPTVVGCLVHDRHPGKDPRVGALSKVLELVE